MVTLLVAVRRSSIDVTEPMMLCISTMGSYSAQQNHDDEILMDSETWIDSKKFTCGRRRNYTIATRVHGRINHTHLLANDAKQDSLTDQNKYMTHQ